MDHRFFGLNTLIICILMLFCVFFMNYLKKINFLYISGATISILFGILLGIMLSAFAKNSEVLWIAFNADVFYFVLLPPIIWNAAYTCEQKRFFSNLGSILLLAIGGTIISVLVIGYGLLYIVNIGWIDSLESDGTNLTDFLQIGAIFAATDTVAVLTILKNADPNLYSLIFGESVLNDAVSIVLFRIFTEMKYSDKLDILLISFGFFLLITLLSVALGIFISFIFSLWFKRINPSKAHNELTFLFIFAMTSYSLSEMIGLSGIMSLFFCGISLRHFNHHNLTFDGKSSLIVVSHTLSKIAETFVFCYLGITLGLSWRPAFHLKWDVKLMFACILLCLISRFHVFIFSWLLNLGRTDKIRLEMQLMFWIANLRGAITFALALNVSANQAVVTTSSLGVVLFTTIIFAPIINIASSRQLSNLSQPQIQLEPQVFTNANKYSTFHRFWHNLDNKYLKPVLGGTPKPLIVWDTENKVFRKKIDVKENLLEVSISESEEDFVVMDIEEEKLNNI